MVLTQERLKELFDYNPITGVLTRIKDIRHNALAGDIARNKDADGYIQTRIDGRIYPVHRLAWLYVYGKLPSDCIDHINCIKSDNRIINLREATRSQNNKNTKIGITNKSGYKGVSFNKENTKWRAQCRVNGRNYHIGYYDSALDASIAYCAFASKNHGLFFRG